MHELKLMDVQKKYKDKEAVRKFNYTFANGVYGLLGENGAGKTTLMRLICGVLQPTEGSIYCDNIEIASMGAEYRRLLGYLPQDFGYYGDFTAERFLRYMAALKALPEDYANSRIDKLLDMVELKNVKKKKLKTFSGGMIRRIGIAQALLNNPEILILDEPTTGLDPLMRIAFLDIIKEEHKKGKTILMSSHLFNEMEDSCDRVVLIDHGHIIAIADMDKDVRNRPCKDFKIEFKTHEDYEQFKKLDYKVIRDQEQYNQVTININNDEINKLFKSLHNFDVKFIAEVKYTLEKHFKNILLNNKILENKFKEEN